MNLINDDRFKVLEEYRRYWQLPFDNRQYVPFMNHGFYDDSYNLDLSVDDEPFKFMFALYYHCCEHFNIKTENRSLLDIGCGYGKGVNFLKNKFNFGKTYAIDLNPYHIFKAEEIFKDIDFFTFDAKKLNLLNLKVDVIVSVETLCYFSDCDDFYQGLSNIINDDGDIIIATVTDDYHLPIIIDKIEKNNLKLVNKNEITKKVYEGSVLQLKSLQEGIKNKRFNSVRFVHEENILRKTVELYENKERGLKYYTFYLKKNYV